MTNLLEILVNNPGALALLWGFMVSAGIVAHFINQTLDDFIEWILKKLK